MEAYNIWIAVILFAVLVSRLVILNKIQVHFFSLCHTHCSRIFPLGSKTKGITRCWVIALKDVFYWLWLKQLTAHKNKSIKGNHGHQDSKDSLYSLINQSCYLVPSARQYTKASFYSRWLGRNVMGYYSFLGGWNDLFCNCLALSHTWHWGSSPMSGLN